MSVLLAFQIGFDRHMGTSVQLTVVILFVAGYVIARHADVGVRAVIAPSEAPWLGFVVLPYQRTLVAAILSFLREVSLIIFTSVTVVVVTA